MTEHTGPVERAAHGETNMAMQQASAQQSVVDIIKMDHQKVNEHLMELEKRVQGRPSSQNPVFPTMKKMLLGHMAAEEKLVYPLLEQEMRQQVQDAIKEHNEVRQLLEKLSSGGDMPEDEWARHLQMMKQGIQHHVQEEESQMLPAAQQMLDANKLMQIGTQFKQMEQQQM
jgi:hemerythrin superfamily protein